MARFFWPENLDRYRALADGGITARERKRLLTLLAQEIAAFKDERSAPTSMSDESSEQQ